MLFSGLLGSLHTGRGAACRSMHLLLELFIHSFTHPFIYFLNRKKRRGEQDIQGVIKIDS